MFGLLRGSANARQPSPLDIDEQRARVEKLRLESELLSLQRSARAQRYEGLKVAAGIGGLATGVAALLGLAFSGYQWLDASESTRRVRVEERLDRALALMGEDSASSRLAGVVSLNSFLRGDDSDHATQVLLAFTNALALEQSVTVRNAIVASLDAFDASIVEASGRDRALRSLVLVSRGLVQEGDLWRQRRDSPYSAPPHDSVESRAASVASAITAMLRKGVRIHDMSRIYLAGADLRQLDLSGVAFDDAILAWSDFSGAKLENASFKDADLEQVLFVGANARRASFAASLDDTPANRHLIYVEQQMWRASRLPRTGDAMNPQYTIWGPDFTCADLSDADFTGHPTIPIYPNGVTDRFHVYGLSFKKANLRGATLSPIRAFGLVPLSGAAAAGPFPITRGGGAHEPNGVFMQTEVIIHARKPLANQRAEYDAALNNLRYVFFGSNWQTAVLDVSLREALTIVGTPEGIYSTPCRPE